MTWGEIIIIGLLLLVVAEVYQLHAADRALGRRAGSNGKTVELAMTGRIYGYARVSTED